MTTHTSAWKSGWTGGDPVQIGYVHVPADAGTWELSHHQGLESRDLGLGAASKGKLGVRHLRVAADGPDPDRWVAHDVDFQFLYVLKGSVRVEGAGGRATTLAEGGGAHQPRGYRHRFVEVSPDFEAVEITGPATFTSDTATEAGPDSSAAPVYSDDSDENYVMANGPRPFFKYRDLGTRGPTEERMHIHVVRATGQPGEGTGWHYHTMAQWFMILGGESDIRVEDGPRITLRVGDTMCIGSGTGQRHNVAPFSGDYAVLEMCVPAVYDTIPVEAPDGAAP